MNGLALTSQYGCQCHRPGSSDTQDDSGAQVLATERSDLPKLIFTQKRAAATDPSEESKKKKMI